jgi:hypothetical protein
VLTHSGSPSVEAAVLWRHTLAGFAVTALRPGSCSVTGKAARRVICHPTSLVMRAVVTAAATPAGPLLKARCLILYFCNLIDCPASKRGGVQAASSKQIYSSICPTACKCPTATSSVLCKGQGHPRTSGMSST